MKEALLYLHDQCNYDCSYCILNQDWFETTTSSKAATPDGHAGIVEFFRHRHDWHIFLTGGEPTILPGFVELAHQLSKYNYLRLDTNNSMTGPKLKEFMERVPPDRVDFIRCSLHPQDQDVSRLDSWLGRVKQYRDAGYKAFVSWVAAPENLDLLSSLKERVSARGIPFVVSPLVTDKYPASYTARQRDLLDQSMSSAIFREQLDNPFRECRGKLCVAGFTRIKINGINGDIFPCFRAATPVLGNIYRNELKLYSEPAPCSQDNCSYFLEPHLEIEDLVRRDLDWVLTGGQNYDEAILRKLKSYRSL